MVQPINYSIDVQSPFEAALGGFKLGANVAEIKAAQTAREQAQAGQAALAELFKNPNATSADYARVTAFLPKDQAAIVTQGFEAQTKEQQQNTLRSSAQVYSAIKAGNTEAAQSQLADQATALRNSGKEKEAKGFDDLSSLISMNPTGAQATIALNLAMLPGGTDFLNNADKALTTLRNEAKAPSELAESTAKAKKATVEATYADQLARLGIKKTEADIAIAKQNSNIAALNANISRETNVIKRDELILKRDERQDKLSQASRDQKSLLDSQISGIDNFLNTAIRASNTPKNVREGASGPIASRILTTSQDTSDYEGLIETLGAQAFLAQIPQIKGLGALSEKEGDKLQASLQNLSLKQSDARLQENIKEASRLLTKARENILARSGLIAPPPDTPAATLVEVATSSGTFKFPNQAAADAFKQRAGIK